MKLMVFGKDERYIGNVDSLTRARHVEEINGEDVLEISWLGREIGKDYKIVYQQRDGVWKEFIVKETVEEKGSQGVVRSAYCESSFYETIGDYIHDRRPYESTAVSALSVALEPTRWKVGAVADLGIGSVNYYHTNAKAAVRSIIDEWGGEIRTRVTITGSQVKDRYVDFLKRRGTSTGRRFTYRNNLAGVVRTIHRDDVITALYGYGKGEYIEETGGWGRRISFAEINGGVGYVENDEARLIWGRNDGNGDKAHVFGVAEFDDCEDREELLELTIAKLEELSEPVISYDVTVNLVGDLELGDTVTVIDKEFEPELRVAGRVIRIERDLLRPENTRLTIGRFYPSILDTVSQIEKTIGNWRAKADIWNRAGAFDADGKLPATEISDLSVITQMSLQLNAVYAGAMGYHVTEIVNPLTGASIMFMHDEPDIRNSAYIACAPEPGTFLWTTGGWNEGEPNWNHGWDKDGNALFRKIVAEGVDIGQPGDKYTTKLTPSAWRLMYQGMPVVSVHEDEMRIPKILASEYVGIGRIKFIPSYKDEDMIGTDVIFLDNEEGV